MQIQEKNLGKIVQIYLDGRFDANTAPAVEEAIRGWIEKGIYRIVLDMANVPFIASAGLRVVLATTKELRQSFEGDLRVSSLQASPGKVFEISGLDNVLKLFADVESASASF